MAIFFIHMFYVSMKAGMPILNNTNIKLIDDAIKTISGINVKTKLGDCLISTKKSPETADELYLSIQKLSDNTEIGHEVLSFNTKDKTFYGYDIKTAAQYRSDTNSPGYRIGELLRLTSIIELLENNFKSLTIISKPEAVFFHSKYKFIPEINSYSRFQKTLKTIADNTNQDFQNLAQRAKEALATQIQSAFTLDKLFDQANNIAKEYFQKVNNGKYNRADFQMENAVKMNLTREEILKNKDFFNSLYKKHGINYQI